MHMMDACMTRFYSILMEQPNYADAKLHLEQMEKEEDHELQQLSDELKKIEGLSIRGMFLNMNPT
jgi:hypothetical protein